MQKLKVCLQYRVNTPFCVAVLQPRQDSVKTQLIRNMKNQETLTSMDAFGIVCCCLQQWYHQRACGMVICHPVAKTTVFQVSFLLWADVHSSEVLDSEQRRSERMGVIWCHGLRTFLTIHSGTLGMSELNVCETLRNRWDLDSLYMTIYYILSIESILSKLIQRGSYVCKRFLRFSLISHAETLQWKRPCPAQACTCPGHLTCSIWPIAIKNRWCSGGLIWLENWWNWWPQSAEFGCVGEISNKRSCLMLPEYNICKEHAEDFAKGGRGQPVTLCIHHTHSCKYIYIYIWGQVKIGGPEQAPGPHPFHTPVPYPLEGSVPYLCSKPLIHTLLYIYII